MAVSSYDSTYETATTPNEDSMFGTPIYARRVKRQDKNNKIFMGAAAVGVLAAAGALLWATSAANDRPDSPQVATAKPVAIAAPVRPVMAQPVITPVTPAVEPVLQAAPVRAAAPRAARTSRARVAATAPSAAESGANVSTREYAPVTAAPAPAIEPAPAPIMADEPPASTPVLIIPE